MKARRVEVRAVAAIVRKDLAAVLRSRSVMIPLVVVPVVLLVALPLFLGLGAAFVPGLDAELAADLERLIAHAPAGLAEDMAGLAPAQRPVVLALETLFAPLYLVVPLLVASVIAADSFAGERERGTLEALLYTPTDDRELFLAKALAAWLPSTAVALGGGVLYVLVANAAAWPVLGRALLPTPMWVGLILWVGPGVAALGITATAWISTLVDGFREAHLLGGILVVPIVALVVAQAAGLLYLSASLALLLGVAAWTLALVFLRAGWRRFTRDALASRM